VGQAHKTGVLERHIPTHYRQARDSLAFGVLARVLPYWYHWEMLQLEKLAKVLELDPGELV